MSILRELFGSAPREQCDEYRRLLNDDDTTEEQCRQAGAALPAAVRDMVERDRY